MDGLALCNQTSGVGTLAERTSRGTKTQTTSPVGDGDANSDHSDREGIDRLARILIVNAVRLQEKYGLLYWLYLRESIFFLELTMEREAIGSPILAAVHMGGRGEFTATGASEEDAFELLVQGGLAILLSDWRPSRTLN